MVSSELTNTESLVGVYLLSLCLLTVSFLIAPVNFQLSGVKHLENMTFGEDFPTYPGFLPFS